MHTTADKVSKHVTTVQRQSAEPFFARKQASSFFGNTSQSSFIQPKLNVSHPEDAQEKEADQMAHQVMTMPETTPVAPVAEQKEEVQRTADEKQINRSADEKQKEEVQKQEAPSIQMKEETEEVQRSADEEVQRKEEKEEATISRVEEKQEDKIHTKLVESSSGNSGHSVMRMCSNCATGGHSDKKEETSENTTTLQRSLRGPPAETNQNGSFEQNLQTSRGTGSPLPAETRSFMESRFSADFSGVRVHTSDTSVQMNQQINAQAFTYGNDLYFNSGKYAPSTSEGKTLLAHELTHTIQQGASSHVSSPATAATSGTNTVATKTISRKNVIQRSPSNLAAAVGLAKGEQGKVIANKEGADGFRFGWQQLTDYFKTTLGAEKVLPEGAAGDSTTVPISNIKKKNTAKGVNVITPDGKLAVGDRDAMPSWCGIFAFWSLNKAGIPMKKWLLGNMTIPPEAAIAPGVAPQPGFIAYRNLRSHYGLVSSVQGSKISTVNGNTAGADNLGGEIQEQTHDLANWTAFIDPMKLTDGAVRNPETGVEGKSKSLREMQSEMFGVQRKENEGHTTEGIEDEGKDTDGKEIQTKKQEVAVQAQASSPSAKETEPKKEELQRKEENKEEEADTQSKEHLYAQAGANGSGSKPVHRKEEESGIHSGANNEELLSRAANSSPPEHQKDQAKQPVEEEKNIQRNAIIDKAANSSPPVVNSTVLQSNESSVASVQLHRSNLIQSAADSSPPAQQAEKQPATTVQRKSGPKVQRLFGWISDAANWVGDRLEDGKKWLLGKIKDLIVKVPGYKALRIVLGHDPISGETIEPTGYNFIDAAIDLMPFGSLIKQKLEELGILEQAAKFVEKSFGRVRKLISGIADTFANFFDSLSLSDLKDIPGVFRRLENAFTSFFDQVIDFAKGIATDFLEFIKKALLIPLGIYIKTKTKFWDLLCLIIGKDPLTDEVKKPTGANILNAILGISDEGIEQRKKMQETGTFNKVAAWIDKGISVFSRAYDMLVTAFKGLWNMVTINALMHPVETFLKIFDSFWQPIKLVGTFFIQAGIAILKIVKEVLFKWISAKAKETKGFYLVTVLIAKDPFTGERVPRTTENLIKGFMLLSENGEQQFNKMKESGAIDRATAKIDAAVAILNFTWEYVKGLFISLWESFSWKDLLLPILAFGKIIATFKNPIQRLITFIINVVVALFEVILRMMGFPIDLVYKLIDNVKKAWASIKANPSGFLMNLLKAIKQGFTQFFDNILTHLWNGLKAWLKQELEDAGVPMPTDYTVMGIIKWILAILDITMEKIWKKLEARVGKEKVDKIRNLIAKAEAIIDKANEAMEFIEDVRKRGMDAIVDKIKEKLSNMWDMVLEAIKSFIMDQIIKKVTAKLLSMLDPTGIMAVINSAIALYKAIQSFFKYLARILGIINSFVEGIIEICAGNIATAANFLENSLASGIPVVIGFLANQVGLDLSGRIKDILGTVREKVDKGLDFLIDKLVGFVEKLVEKVIAAKDKVLGWLGLSKPVKTKDGASHTLKFAKSGNSGQLMMHSYPMTFGEYIKEVKDKNGIKDDDPKLQTAIITAGEIDTIIKQPDPTDDKAKKDKEENLNSKLSQLAKGIEALPLDITGKDAGTIYGSANNGYGTSATVAFRKAPFTPLGSETTSSYSIGNLHKLNIRKNSSKPFYIKGHLLNSNLGGPGNDSKNLAPISEEANANHKTNFENPVKKAVNGTESGNSTLEHGYMKGFSVVASYGRQEPSSLTDLKNKKASDADDYPDGYKSHWVLSKVIEVLEAEKFTPLNFSCNATIKEKTGTEHNINVPIQNEIHYGTLSDYDLDGIPTQPISIAEDIIKKNHTINSDSDLLNAFQGINMIGIARAKKIYKAFQTNQTVSNGKSQIGIGLLALNENNKGKFIKWGTYSGPITINIKL